ncbi:phage tail fiber protein [Acetobacter sp.]|uniref:phage tail fiber protein n=1 Tax=Acetobacter sp. TaxID=440 RepID=UPI0039EA97C1
MGLDITSANAIFTITVPSLYNAPVTLQNFGASRAWDIENQEMGVGSMSLDGYYNAGFRYAPVQQTITLSASSDSVVVFEAIISAQIANASLYRLNGMITLTATGRKYTLTNGLFLTGSMLPSAEETLAERTFQVNWGRVLPAGI